MLPGIRALAAAIHLHHSLGNDVEGAAFLAALVQRMAEGEALPLGAVHHAKLALAQLLAHADVLGVQLPVQADHDAARPELFSACGTPVASASITSWVCSAYG